MHLTFKGEEYAPRL